MKKWLFCMALAAGCFTLFGMSIEIKNNTPFKITGIRSCDSDLNVKKISGSAIPAGGVQKMTLPDKLKDYSLLLDFDSGLKNVSLELDDYKKIKRIEIVYKNNSEYSFTVSKRSKKTKFPAGQICLKCQRDAKITAVYVCRKGQTNKWKKCELFNVNKTSTKMMCRVPVDGKYFIKFKTLYRHHDECTFKYKQSVGFDFSEIEAISLKFKPFDFKVTGEKNASTADDDED